ncbi:MAG: SufD family Fe-S cluster assembly protein [Oscillospiraceae bacterium]|nr:SufD family Fe-S cluster assembly protein [Oscillospiraceae bacterium]MDD4369279.1 SufD family Fe-S cluster assembly protein [Oscillospiraceae bacterium]
MRNIDKIRTSLGLDNIYGLYFSHKGLSSLLPLQRPDSQTGLAADSKCDPLTGSCQRDGMSLEPIASPEPEALALFRPVEIEQKKKELNRPLPVDCETQAYRLRISPVGHQVNLPVFMAGERPAATYLDITLESDAEAAITLVTAKTEEPIFLNINLEANSRLDLNVIKMPGYISWQLLSYRAAVGDGASLRQHSVNLDSSAYQAGQVFLRGEGAEARTQTAAFVNSFESQRFDMTIRHEVPHTVSDMFNHGVILADGFGCFAGRGVIVKGAFGSKAEQDSRFLALDPTARAEAYPVLIIDEYDVEAGHAGSVGQMDAEALFYLQSRGLTLEEAHSLITAGYLFPILHDMGRCVPALQKTVAYLQQRVIEKVSL